LKQIKINTYRSYLKNHAKVRLFVELAKQIGQVLKNALITRYLKTASPMRAFSFWHRFC